MTTLLQDVRYTMRALWKSPGFTLVAVVSLALGIGLNTAIFSLINIALIRPVPVIREQGRLVWLQRPVSCPDFVEYRKVNQSFEGMVAISGTNDFSLTRSGESELIKGEYVSEDYFEVLGINPLLGRTFLKDEGLLPVPVVVLSEQLWRTRFNSDPNITGRQILLNGLNFIVIGVAPKGFVGTEVGLNRELWVPLSIYQQLNPLQAVSESSPRSNRFEERNIQWLAVFARLKAGISRDQAGAELTAIARQLDETFGSVERGLQSRIELLTMSGGMDPRDQGEAFPVMVIVMAIVALVLLIACANIGSLLLARAAVRRRETAIRQALGATRMRLVRYWLTESLMLGVLGGALGLLLALWANQLLISYLKTTPLAAINLELDYRVLIFTAIVSVTTGIVFGLAPALQASRLNIVTALKDEVGWQRTGFRHSRLRMAFVTAQVALSVVLLIIAGLLIRSLQRANRIDPGFRIEHALTIPLNLALLRYPETAGQNFYRDLLARVQAQPGVERASLVKFAPLGSAFAQYQVIPESQNNRHPEAEISTGFNLVGPNYFKTMETQLLRGRDFSDADQKGTSGVVVVNAALAARLWPDADPIGKRLSLNGPAGPFLEVIGVARDAKYRWLGERAQPYVYRPVLQSFDPMMTLVVRTAGEPHSVATAIREQIRALDPKLPVADMKPMQAQLDLSLLPSRLAAWTLGGFGILALLLAGLGIYGVVSYAVAQRTREIGVRMALGASETNVLRLVLREGLLVIGIGVSAGLMLAAVVTRLITGFLYGVGATDPLTFVGVPILLSLVAIAASFVPARRATKVDPIVALRFE